eukprot:7672904-Ditylum_brightwellii.AAC.1
MSPNLATWYIIPVGGQACQAPLAFLPHRIVWHPSREVRAVIHVHPVAKHSEQLPVCRCEVKAGEVGSFLCQHFLHCPVAVCSTGCAAALLPYFLLCCWCGPCPTIVLL